MQYITCFGDSLTEFGFDNNWVSRLAAAYTRRANVVNCGLGGYNSRWFLEILQDTQKRVLLLPDHVREPLFATLLFGSNDLASNEQGVPLGEYIANMEAIIKYIHTEVRPQYGIFVLTPPPVDEDAWRCFKQLETSNRTLSAVRLYRSAVLDIVANLQKHHPEMHVHLVDTHEAILHHASPATARQAALNASWEPTSDSAAPWTRLLVDGLHINEIGGEIFYSTLHDAIRTSSFADKLLPENLPMLLPDRLVLMEEERQRREKAS